MRFPSALPAAAILAAASCSDSLAPSLQDTSAAIVVLAASYAHSGTGGELRQLAYAGSSTLVLLRDTGLVRLGPFWPSPSGDVVMYRRNPMSGDAETLERLRLRGSSAPFHPAGVPAAWSPDGTRIVWTASRYSGQLIIATDPNGDAPDTVASGNDPVWGPDNRTLYFGYAPTNTDNEIAAFDLLGARTTVNLTNNPATDATQRPSPDGHWIAFVSDRPPGSGIYLMRPDGTEPHRIIAGDNLPAPCWSADGRYLAVPRRSSQPAADIVVLDTAGSVHATISFPFGLGPFSWAPGRDVLLVLATAEYGGVLQAMVVSHDGRQREQLTRDLNGIVAAMWIRR